jgi:hypothetical protein
MIQSKLDKYTRSRHVSEHEWGQRRIGGFGYGCLTILLIWYFLFSSGSGQIKQIFIDGGVHVAVAFIYSGIIEIGILAQVVAKGLGGSTPFDEFKSRTARLYMVLFLVVFLGSSRVISYFL